MAIVDFILARVTEEELLAHAALDGAPEGHPWGSGSGEDHVSCWNPWRVQTTCLVKRQLVHAHPNTGPVVIDTPGVGSQLVASACRTCRLPDGQPAPWPCHTLRVLASEWANHPDYRQEWQPVRVNARRA